MTTVGAAAGSAGIDRIASVRSADSPARSRQRCGIEDRAVGKSGFERKPRLEDERVADHLIVAEHRRCVERGVGRDPHSENPSATTLDSSGLSRSFASEVAGNPATSTCEFCFPPSRIVTSAAAWDGSARATSNPAQATRLRVELMGMSPRCRTVDGFHGNASVRRFCGWPSAWTSTTTLS